MIAGKIMGWSARLRINRARLPFSRRTFRSGSRQPRQQPDLEHLVQATMAQQRKRPSILVYLALGASVATLGYIGYRVTILKETVFVPYAVGSHQRLAGRDEVDHESVRATALHRLLEKCGLDEVVTEALGVPIALDEPELDEFTIWIVTQGPSLNGIEIRPRWPILKSGSRAVDLDIFDPDVKGLLVDRTDPSDKDPEITPPLVTPRRQMVVCGKLNLVGSNRRKGQLTFRLYSDYDRENSPLAFGMGLLVYMDSGELIKQRLW